MKVKVALVALACPVEVGYEEALPLLNATDKAMNEQGIDCENTGVVIFGLIFAKRIFLATRFR